VECLVVFSKILPLFIVVEADGNIYKLKCHVNKSKHRESDSKIIHLNILFVAPEFRDHVVSHGEQENQCCHEVSGDIKRINYTSELTIPLVRSKKFLVGCLGLICQLKWERQLLDL